MIEVLHVQISAVKEEKPEMKLIDDSRVRLSVLFSFSVKPESKILSALKRTKKLSFLVFNQSLLCFKAAAEFLMFC